MPKCLWPLAARRYRGAELEAVLQRHSGGSYAGGVPMLKILAWIVGIIFVIGLLVVFGVIDLIF